MKRDRRVWALLIKDQRQPIPILNLGRRCLRVKTILKNAVYKMAVANVVRPVRGIENAVLVVIGYGVSGRAVRASPRIAVPCLHLPVSMIANVPRGKPELA